MIKVIHADKAEGCMVCEAEPDYKVIVGHTHGNRKTLLLCRKGLEELNVEINEILKEEK